MCPLSVALHYVLVLLAVTINTIGGEPCVDVFSELPRVFWDDISAFYSVRKNCLIQIISTLALLFSLIEPT